MSRRDIATAVLTGTTAACVLFPYLHPLASFLLILRLVKEIS